MIVSGCIGLAISNMVQAQEGWQTFLEDQTQHEFMDYL